MRHVIKRINEKALKKIKLKQFGLFLVASFIFLMLSKLSESSTESVKFNIQITDLPIDKQLVQDSSLVLDVRVKSTGFGFFPLTFINPEPIELSIKDDLQELSNNSYLWVIEPGNENLQSKLPSTFSVVSLRSDSIYFKYDLLASRKLAIKLNADVSYSLGYDIINELKLSQDSVTVIGPKKAIDTLNYIRTQDFVLKDVKTNVNSDISLINPSPIEFSLEQSSVLVSGQVSRFTEGSVMVPVELVNVPNDVKLNYFPKEIRLSYYVDLERFKEVTKDDFKVVCDYLEFEKSGEFYLSPQLKVLTSTVKSARINTNRIDFIFL